MYERIPEKDTSIPFTTYGKGTKFSPLKNEDQTLYPTVQEVKGQLKRPSDKSS
jgi:hypothetical protein